MSDDDDDDPFGLNEFALNETNEAEEVDYSSVSEDDGMPSFTMEDTDSSDHMDTHSEESDGEKDVRTSERESRYDSFDSPTPIRGLKTRDLENRKEKSRKES